MQCMNITKTMRGGGGGERKKVQHTVCFVNKVILGHVLHGLRGTTLLTEI